ncbi:Cytochrome d ubiquinol oxidase subunit I [Patulibacter medicamentivorans]|uniref:Cytochrome d ubiquinol oxidase subunit I n=2 Tax=Patulibacter medicamentivorans TaxID=1097667 RepID=H0E514_9ACTN|nr:Cytochrome d ubiquinol oxidase subunit I [Patulibacter medicamentivorans]
MQNPVGYRVDAETGNAVLTSIWAVMSSPTAVFAYLHTIPAAVLTASALVVGISVWHLGRRAGHETAFFRRSAQWGLRGMLVASLVTIVVGHFFGQVMTEKQPMKMAAAEALYDSKSGAGLSLMALAPFQKKPDRVDFEIKIPKLLSFMATDSFNGRVEGINDLQADYAKKYAPYEIAHGRDPAKAEYYPIVGLSYWTFRLMIGLGGFMLLFSIAGLWIARRGREGIAGMAARPWFRRLALATLLFGFAAHAMGWMFTEVGRQPWVVTGLLKTQDAVSKLGVSTLVISLSVFIALYVVITGIEVWLFARLAKQGPDPLSDDTPDEDAAAPALAY